MPTTITGNPTGVVAPMATPPTANQVPAYSVPVDGEAGSAGSLSSMEQQSANHLAWLMQQAVWNATFPTTGSNLPQMRLKDAAGNGRAVVDHLGYIGGGRISRFTEEWMIAPGGTGSVWSNAGGAGGAVATSNPNANYGARSVQLTPATAGAGIYNTSAPKLFMSNASFLSGVMEFELGLNTAAIGNTSNVDFYVGLGSQGDASTDTNQIAIAKFHNITNYQLITSSAGGLPASQSTSIAPTANPNSVPIDRIRIEVHGSASYLGAYTVRLFINETLAISYNLSNVSAALMPVVACANMGGAPVGSPLAYVGPVSVTWNRFLSGPNL